MLGQWPALKIKANDADLDHEARIILSFEGWAGADPIQGVSGFRGKDCDCGGGKPSDGSNWDKIRFECYRISSHLLT
jgi:hypothetical protein